MELWLGMSILSVVGVVFGSLAILSLGRSWPLRVKGDGRAIGGPALLLGAIAGGIPFFSTLPLPLILGGIVILSVGLIDDIMDLAPWQKLIGQGIAALLVVIGLSSRCSLLIAAMPLPTFLGYAGTWIWVVGVTNAVNLVDGLDGVVLGILLAPLLVLLAIALGNGNPGLTGVSLGMVIGFYPFNRHRGRLLLGDTGAELLGYLLSLLILTNLSHDVEGWHIVPALFLVAVPLGDTAFAILRRLAHGRPVFQGDKRHIHHRLAKRFGVRKAVLILTFISLIFSCGGWLLWRIGI